jgi:hypothetical protein
MVSSSAQKTNLQPGFKKYLRNGYKLNPDFKIATGAEDIYLEKYQLDNYI